MPSNQPDTSLEELWPRARALEPTARAALATRILDSLAMPVEDEDLWLEEAAQRLDAFERGAMGTQPAESALAQARDAVQAARG